MMRFAIALGLIGALAFLIITQAPSVFGPLGADLVAGLTGPEAGPIAARQHLFSLLLPALGLVGIGLAYAQQQIGPVVMFLAALAMVLMTGANLLAALSSGFLGAGAILAWRDIRRAKAARATA